MATYLGTLRPAGDLGDHLDATYVEGSDFTGTVSVPSAPLALGDLGFVPESIDFLRFYARVTWATGGGGPDNAQVWLQWREGAGAYVSTDPEFPPTGIWTTVPTENPPTPIDYPTRPGGGPWTVAAVNDLQMRCQFFVSDNGSGVETTCYVADLWAEVWGTPASDVAEGTVAASGTAAVAVGDGEAGDVALGGTAAVTVGVGEVNPTAVGGGTAAVAIGSGTV